MRLVGLGRGARWQAIFDHQFEWQLPPQHGEDEMWRHVKATMPIGELVSDPVRRCLDYGVTEMLNNAIDHSGGSIATLMARVVDRRVEVVIGDDGVGAWNRVREYFDLPSELDAITHVAKGKQTTAAERHSGQGLFFTSKMFDAFEVDAGAHRWRVDNLRSDQAVAPGSGLPGTRVHLTTAVDSSRQPSDVFAQFSDDDNQFDRTRIRVSLSRRGIDFISRSEAKRLALGLEQYEVIELDFAGVTEVGQGFVDELFRVWRKDHPGTTVTYTNASPEVTFMIERGLPRR